VHKSLLVDYTKVGRHGYQSEIARVRSHSQSTDAVTLVWLVSSAAGGIKAIRSRTSNRRLRCRPDESRSHASAAHDQLLVVDETNCGKETRKFQLVDEQDLLHEAHQKAGHVRKGAKEFVLLDSKWSNARAGHILV
jgi:hypothetical protein